MPVILTFRVEGKRIKSSRVSSARCYLWSSVPAWNPASKNKAKIKQNPLNLQSVKCEYHCSYDVGIYIFWVTTKEIIFHTYLTFKYLYNFPLGCLLFLFLWCHYLFLWGFFVHSDIPCQCGNLSFSWDCFLFPLYIKLFLCQDICFSKSHLVLQGPEQATDGKQSAGGSSPSSCLTVVFTGAYALNFNRTESCSHLGNEIEQLTCEVF